MNSFCLLPDMVTGKDIIQFNKDFSSDDLRLDQVTAIPHLTILQTEFKKGFSGLKLLQDFRNTDMLSTERTARLGEIGVSEKGLIFFYLRAIPRWLQALNAHVIMETKDAIDTNGFDSSDQTFENSSEREAFEITGYKYNLDAYQPHFTLGSERQGGVGEYLMDVSHTVRFRRLAFTENGPHGEIRSILGSLPLPVSWD